MKAHGFVTLLLMAVLAAVIAMGTTIWQAARQNIQMAVVVQEEAVARNIAEQCLSKGVAVAAAHFQGRGNNAFDFDRLLDPVAAGTNDDFLFCNGGAGCTTPPRAFLPSTSTATTSQYAFEFVDPDEDATKGRPGACLIRFDDNNDDNLQGYEAQTSNTDGVLEGPAAGQNVRNRDRDASIVITAIGIYPVDASVNTDAARSDAYAKARAHVTMRQYFSAVPAPFGFATGEITVKGNSELCGTGGLRAQEVTFANTSCMCGDLLAAEANGSTTSSGVVQCPAPACTDAVGPNTNARPGLDGGVPLGDFDARSSLDLRAPPNVMQVRTPAEEYPQLCINKSETLGEVPRQVFGLDDTVTWGQFDPASWTWSGLTDTPAGETNAAGPRWYQMAKWWVREDGAVFLWDSRPPTDLQEQAANAIRCDGHNGNGPWPVAPQNDNTAKNTFASGGNPGSNCMVTIDEFDDEFADRPNLTGPGPYGGTLSSCAANADPDTCDTDGIQRDVPDRRCDRWDVAALSTDTTAAKNGRCATFIPDAQCGITANPRDRETCTLNFPGSPNAGPDLRCFDVWNPWDYQPLGTGPSGGGAVPAWNTFNRSAAQVAMEDAGSNLIRGANDPVVPGQIMDWDAGDPSLNARRLCWRMVAHLGDGTVHPGEWESAAGTFTIPAGRPTVPNFRSDRFLVPDPAADVVLGMDDSPPALSDFTQAYSDGGAMAGQPFLRLVGGRFEIVDGINNQTNRVIPRRNQWRFDGDVQFGRDVDIAFTSFYVDGDVTTRGGRLGLSAWDGWVQPQTYTANLAQNCSVEAELAPREAWRDWSGWKNTIKATGSCNIDVDSFVSFGRLACQGDILLDANGDEACVVGGIGTSRDGPRLSMPSECRPDGCDNPSVCLVNRTGLIGSIYSSRDLSIPNGVFASRSNQAWPAGKISQLMGRGNVCVANASRVVGQITTDGASRGGVGNIWIGPDVTMMQSGEVGYGFVTKPTVWTESTW
jgi:hypothetical protein